MDSPSPRCTLAYRIADARPREQVTAALAQCGFTLLAVPRDEPARDGFVGNMDLLIDDLSPWDDSASDRVVARRTRRPRLPILIYYPDTIAATMLATRAALLPGVAIRHQAPLLPGEAQQIARMVYALLAGVPALTVRFVVDDLLPHAGLALTFMERAIARMQEEREHPPRVTDLCAKLFVSKRALERACHRGGVPAPKRIVEWIILLYVAATAEYYGESVACAAKRVGRSGEYVRQLRAHLLPEIGTLRGLSPSQLCTLTVLGFARACGLPRARAEEVLERVRVAGSGS